MLKFANSLFGRVVIALLAGILLGIVSPGLAVGLKPIGDGFIKIIQMIVAPLVFCVIIGNCNLAPFCSGWPHFFLS
jgi:aerobic C4-dicarboxylate transport protein